MQVSVDHVRLTTRPRVTRLPFRFGAVTLTTGSSVRCEVAIRTGDGKKAIGYSGDLLVPKWFSKRPETTVEEDQQELLGAARAAGEALQAAPADRPFALWWGSYAPGLDGVSLADPALMVRGFGFALVERALIDACCRAAKMSFFEALETDLFGFDAGAIHASASGCDLGLRLGDELPDSIRVRHTVGMRDPLRVADLRPEDRLDDGLPQALEEDVAAYGIDWFKIKIGQGPEEDAARLLAIHEVLAELAPGYGFTVDGNEQYESMRDLLRCLSTLRSSSAGREMLSGLALIEQPLHRRATFDPARNDGIDEVSEDFGPVIIDEADSCPAAFAQAVELGYRGVSIKNCKGVFRALASRALCRAHSTDARVLFQSGEDLTNLPILPLQQDLCTATALGVEHVERNGHHYFRGLDHLEPDQAAAAADAHSDLYRPIDDGGFALRIEEGRIRCGSLNCVGYGYRAGLVRPEGLDG